MIYVLVAIHILVCVFLVIVVLLQSGKAADLAGAFGGMGSQTAFGPRGAATVLSKATTIAAVLFMTTSLVLSIHATRNAGGAAGGPSVLDQEKTKTGTAPAPAAPTPTPTKGTSAGGSPPIVIGGDRTKPPVVRLQGVGRSVTAVPVAAGSCAFLPPRRSPSSSASTLE